MARPKINRKINFNAEIKAFVPLDTIMPEEVLIETDEFEALRLKDLLNLDQREAAKAMSISQPTFHRIVSSARKKVAEALVKGKVIKIKEY